MKTILKINYILILSLFILNSCKKEDIKISLREKLSAKTWKSTGLKENGISQAKWCWLNSLYDYANSGNLYFTQGDNQGACNSSITGKIYTYKYAISPDEKWIIKNPAIANGVDSFEVISISETTLVTKRNIDETEVWEDTFTAQ